ncbi:MAG: DUF3426 domain-containing protein [Pseudomonadota bacterium]
MIVTCQNCDARFSLNDGLVKKTGSKVRCSKCKHVFMIYPDELSVPGMLSTDAGYESPPAPPKSVNVQKLGLGDTLDGESIVGGDLDLSEIEKMLATDAQGEVDGWVDPGKPDMEAGKEKSPAVEPAVTSMTMALDLSEIEKMFEMEADMGDADKTLESEPEDLVFDFEESATRTKEPQKELSDFDIADIEKLLEEEIVDTETDETGGLLFKSDAPLSPAFFEDEKGKDDAEPFAFSDMDELMETDAAVKADADTGDEEAGLLLEMDDDFKPEAPSSSPERIAAIEELDFSDLEESIKADAQSAEEALMEDEEEELTLALDSDDRFEIPSAVTPSSESSESPDLSMLEDLLKDKAPEPSEEVSLELDLAEITPKSSDTVQIDDLELQFDETDMEDRAVADTTVEMDSDQPTETEDLDLEFSDDEREEALEAEEGTVEDAESTSEEAEEEEAEVAAPVASDIQPAKAKRSRKPVVLVLVLVLLTGAAVGGHLLFKDKLTEFLNKKGIEIPFISSGKKPVIPDAGNLKITTIDIDNRFVENSAAGRLFVISGRAQNGYGDSRSSVRITGKLYAKNKQLVTSETVYCGNVISEPELSTLSPEDIKNRLGNRQGDNGANVNIKPGEDRPFMVVFSKLPENLEEFTLEVAGSESAAQAPLK